MAQESKKIIVKRLGTPGMVAVDLLPWATAGDVLRQIGAGPGMGLSTAPQLGIVFDEGAELWNHVQHAQTLYAVQGKGPY